MCPKFKDLNIYSLNELQKMKTRQLLAELHNTYSMGCPYCWEDADWQGQRNYKEIIKSVLVTREHIPNKQESKAIRKAKIKKGV